MTYAHAVLALLLAATAAQSAETQLPTLAAELFSLADVTLLDPELLKIRELTRQYLLALDSDRLLRNYRENFGIQTGLPELTGHESATGPHSGARGHYTGHYLSACAMMIASTGDAKLKAKADAMVAELARLQQPNGYLSAQPEEYFDDLEKNGRHIVWYSQHKLLAGLLEMYVQTGNAQALEVARKFGDWVVTRTGKIDHDRMQKILKCEFGGIGEAMANLAAITGDKRYLQAARCFDHDEVLKPLAAGQDVLTKHHGNTEIPKFIAAAREYELTGEEPYRKAAEFFWQQVALHRSYVTGGNTNAERFGTPPDVLSTAIYPVAQESCNTYNMLKLTEHVFGWTPRADVGDFHERALYNHILATPHPETGMPLYYLGLSPGQWKMHFAPHQSFWCCAGTGLENFSKLQRGIYYHGKHELWVNLFIASELDWKETGVTIRQQTAFPNEPGTTLVVHAKVPTPLKAHIRIPYWTNDAAIEVNGEPLKANLKPGSFATIDRTWRDGDTVKARLPMRLHLEPTPDNPNVAAVMVGPVVLAGELGPVAKEKVQVQPTEYHCIELFHKDQYPQAGQLALAGITEKIADWLEPVAGKPLTFKTKGVGRPHDFVLSPFYRLFDQRYNVYWKLQSATVTTGNQPAVRVEKDVAYLSPERAEKADLYLPPQPEPGKRYPGIVIIHGGGWSAGDKGSRREQNIGTTLASHGYVCMSINYALATATSPAFPQNIQDCRRAVRRLRKNAARFQLDASHIGAIGGSAGGHLVALLAVSGPDTGIDPQEDAAYSCRIQAAVPMYPHCAASWEAGVGPKHVTYTRLWMFARSQTEAPALWDSASPLKQLSKDDPPMLILHGTADITTPLEQSTRLHEAARKIGVPSELIVIEGAPHSFDLQPKQRDLRPDVLAFFDKHLKPHNGRPSEYPCESKQ